MLSSRRADAQVPSGNPDAQLTAGRARATRLRIPDQLQAGAAQTTRTDILAILFPTPRPAARPRINVYVRAPTHPCAALSRGGAVCRAQPAHCQPRRRAGRPHPTAVRPHRSAAIAQGGVQALLGRQDYRAGRTDARPIRFRVWPVDKRASSHAVGSAVDDRSGRGFDQLGQVSAAHVWLERALAGLRASGRLSRQALAEQAASRILLSKAYGRLEKPDRAAASSRPVLGRYQQAKMVDPVVQLELLAQLSFARRRQRARAFDGSLKDETGRLAEQLASDHERGLVGNDDYAHGLRPWPTVKFILAQLAGGHGNDRKADPLARPTGTKSSKSFRPAGGWPKFIAGRPTAEPKSKRSGGARAAGRRRAAETARHRICRFASATSVPRSSGCWPRQCCADSEARRRSSNSRLLSKISWPRSPWLARTRPPSTAGVSEGRLLERIADVAGQRVELGTTDAGQLAEQRSPRTCELLESYRQTLLADDPRIASLGVDSRWPLSEGGRLVPRRAAVASRRWPIGAAAIRPTVPRLPKHCTCWAKRR